MSSSAHPLRLTDVHLKAILMVGQSSSRIFEFVAEKNFLLFSNATPTSSLLLFAAIEDRRLEPVACERRRRASVDEAQVPEHHAQHALLHVRGVTGRGQSSHRRQQLSTLFCFPFFAERGV